QSPAAHRSGPSHSRGRQTLPASLGSQSLASNRWNLGDQGQWQVIELGIGSGLQRKLDDPRPSLHYLHLGAVALGLVLMLGDVIGDPKIASVVSRFESVQQRKKNVLLQRPHILIAYPGVTRCVLLTVEDLAI